MRRPRGRKVWALLAYLALSHGQPSRQQLIDLLFPEAEDPAGTLRWNLSELRRLLGGPDTVGSGNVVQLRLPAGTVIDVLVAEGRHVGRGRRPPRPRARAARRHGHRREPRVRRVAARRASASAGSERGGPAGGSAPSARVRRRAYRGRVRHAAGGRRSVGRGRPCAARPGVRRDRRRRRGATAALGVDRSLPSRARRGAGTGACRGGHDRDGPSAPSMSEPAARRSRRSSSRARRR